MQLKLVRNAATGMVWVLLGGRWVGTLTRYDSIGCGRGVVLFYFFPKCKTGYKLSYDLTHRRKMFTASPAGLLVCDTLVLFVKAVLY